MSDKYLVVKRDDFEKIRAQMDESQWHTAGVLDALAKIDLRDAEVIRQQDITASPILFCYASLVRSYAELPGMDPKRIEALNEVADWAMNAAESALKVEHKKYPD